MAKTKPKFQLVTKYPISDYKCGACAGNRVRLRQDIVVRDHQGKPTGVVHPAGEIWFVISGSAVPPLDVWLKQPSGERSTWSDDADFWVWFEKVDDKTT